MKISKQLRTGGKRQALSGDIDKVFDRLDSISTKYTNNLAGFIGALTHDDAVKKNPRLKDTLEKATKLAHDCDVLIGKALILAAGGHYPD